MCVYTYMCVYACMCVYVSFSLCIVVYIHTYMNTLYLFLHIHIFYIYIYIHIHIHTFSHRKVVNGFGDWFSKAEDCCQGAFLMQTRAGIAQFAKRTCRTSPVGFAWEGAYGWIWGRSTLWQHVSTHLALSSETHHANAGYVDIKLRFRKLSVRVNLSLLAPSCHLRLGLHGHWPPCFSVTA